MIYLRLFFTFFKIGAFTFGGGYAMLPLIAQETEKNGWLKSEQLLDFLAISESTPGPLAINIATFVGTETAGIPGALMSTLGVVLPSFIIILLVARSYEKYKDSFFAKGIMIGLKPAVIGLILSALIGAAVAVFLPSGSVFSVFGNPMTYFNLTVFIISAILVFKNVNAIIVIIACAILGLFRYFIPALY